MTTDEHHVLITENYVNYEPPFPIKGIIAELLDSVSKDYLNGLQAVILTNSSGLNRKGRRQTTRSRKKSVEIVKCLGLYNKKWHDRPATIQLFVDNIIEQAPKYLLVFSIWKRVCFGNVLFHELGHHIHAIVSPQYKEREDVAEEWSKRLHKESGQKRYWCLHLWPLKPVLKLFSISMKRIIKIIDNYNNKRQIRR